MSVPNQRLTWNLKIDLQIMMFLFPAGGMDPASWTLFMGATIPEVEKLLVDHKFTIGYPKTK